MPRLRPVHWRKFERFLLDVGCEFSHQEGDHRIYKRADLKRPLVVPTDKDVPKFIIRNNLRVLKISTPQYLKMVK
ncbi:type II toxin-antitoxin system HicA family toxin [bacterium]|nr:type II toxin-antitoxin system HicA family toxin [bacterium]MCK4436445.1 type II toxin-antitoxin system HicA family toxin [bacterium]